MYINIYYLTCVFKILIRKKFKKKPIKFRKVFSFGGGIMSDLKTVCILWKWIINIIFETSDLGDIPTKS